MADKVKIIKGFQDVVPPLSLAYSRLEDAARSVFERFGFQEIRLPVLERTELFARGIGEGTDIVEKEMYTFPDRRGRSLSLRPEGTASVVRAYVQSDLGKGEPARWYYRGPMFRYERPQKGRYRQFYQIGAEAIGLPGPGTDGEVVTMLDRFFKEAGVKGVRLEINSLGCGKCRPAYRAALIAYLEKRREDLCEDCARRMVRNPLRVLDCKVEGCRSAVKAAPLVLDFLDDDCREHFEGLKGDLDAAGVDYSVNPLIVRGLDYYTRTVFEALADDGLGSQNAVGAGGRYDGLVEEFGGPPTPAIGFAVGVERLAMLAGETALAPPRFFIIASGEKPREEGIRLLARLRDEGVSAAMLTDGAGKSFKAQMKAAARSGALEAIIIGEDEIKSGEYTVKNMKDGVQRKISGTSPEFFAGANNNPEEQG